MTTGKWNVYLGLLVMIAAAFGGFALGSTAEPFFASGHAEIPFWRFLTRAGHTHGMPFGLINVVVGLLITRLGCSQGLKRSLSLVAALSILLPLGVALRGITHGARFAEALAAVGGFSLVAACLVALVGVARTKEWGT